MSTDAEFPDTRLRPEFCQMEWTGERMIPQKCDALTELFHWQRYLYFRPLYDGKKIVDAGSGEGYGIHYASVFAKSAIGVDISDEAIDHGRRRYPNVEFERHDVCTRDYSDADLVLSFEVIEHLPEPTAFLKALSTCGGVIVVSTPHREFHSPGNELEDKPLNEFHTIEWTPTEFKSLIESEFSGRRVQWVSQEGRWPGLLRPGFDPDARYAIAVIGDVELPTWPRIGVSIPTFNGAENLKEAVVTLSRSYPGDMEFAVVSNGCSKENLLAMHELQSQLPYMLTIMRESTNLGYGVGANIGLHYLVQKGGFDLYAVSNDDVMPGPDCVSELVNAMSELDKAGHSPGVIGPVSNAVQGLQQVDIGAFESYPEMMFHAEQYHSDNFNCAFPTPQVRGLFMLISPSCLEAIGGFDPRFGIGNSEDDDWNIRARLAGFSLWVAQGAFLYHKGSQTFQRLNVDYTSLIEENTRKLCLKWGVTDLSAAIFIESIPSGVNLYQPLDQRNVSLPRYEIVLDGKPLDLVHEADEIQFAGWVAHEIKRRPLSDRVKIIEALLVQNSRAA